VPSVSTEPFLGSGDEVRFAFRFDPRYRLAALPFGVTPASCSVVVDASFLGIHFGPWRLHTPLANVRAVHETGPYSFLRTAGPAHLSFADRGVTFATNGERGVCVLFHDPVPAIEPTGRLRHPGATVTVADVPGLVGLLTARLAG
jgi:hypothetical protein